GRGAHGTLGHSHQHVAGEALVASAISPLAVVDQVRCAMEHQHPVATHRVDTAVHGGVRLPGGARSFARHRIRSVHAVHGHLHLVGVAGHFVCVLVRRVSTHATARPVGGGRLPGN